MKLVGKIKKPFSYVPAEAMSPTYLRDKFARIKSAQRKQEEAVQQEQVQKVRKIK